MVRLIVIFILSAILLGVFYTTDLFFSRYLKSTIAKHNHESEQRFHFTPINATTLTVLSLSMWFIPLTLFPYGLLLEYRLILTALYWAALTYITFLYLGRKTDRNVARKSLPFLFIPAFFSGFFIVPTFIILKDLLA